MASEQDEEEEWCHGMQSIAYWPSDGATGSLCRCGQMRGEDTKLLTCRGCRVARICHVDHQKMGSEEAALGGNLLAGRRRDICGALGKRRGVVQNFVSPD